MRVVGVILIIWLIIGAVAVFQRGYHQSDETSCATFATVAVTVIAGPLNYAGVNPKTECDLPEPSP